LRGKIKGKSIKLSPGECFGIVKAMRFAVATIKSRRYNE